MLGTFVPNNGFVRTPFADLCANTSDKVVFFTSKKIFENSSFILAISLADWHRRARGSLLWVVCPEMTSKWAAIQYTMGEYRSECPVKKLLVQDALNKPLRHPTKTRWRKCSYIGLPIHLVSIRKLHLLLLVAMIWCYEEVGKAGCLARDTSYSTQFVLLANFSLWFILILKHKVATYIT